MTGMGQGEIGDPLSLQDCEPPNMIMIMRISLLVDISMQVQVEPPSEDHEGMNDGEEEIDSDNNDQAPGDPVRRPYEPRTPRDGHGPRGPMGPVVLVFISWLVKCPILSAKNAEDA